MLINRNDNVHSLFHKLNRLPAMASPCAEPFVNLLAKIGHDDSDGNWITSLKYFCAENVDAFVLEVKSKKPFLLLLRTKLRQILTAWEEPHCELAFQLCNCIRIAVRDKIDADCLFFESFVADVTSLSEHTRSDVAGMALRCLINLMNENIPASDFFIAGSVDGIKRLVSIIYDGLRGNKVPHVMHLATKFLYMLLSQRQAAIEPLLRTAEAEAILVPQLCLCVGVKTCNDVIVKFQPQLFDDIDVISASEVVLDIGNSVMTAGFVVSDVVIDNSPAAVFPEPPKEMFGNIRHGYKDLFIETCKLLYCLHSIDGGGATRESISGLNITCVYDIIADIIVANRPSDIIENSVGYVDIDSQQLCQRYALQLAMMALDLDAKTMSTSASPIISSSVPRILQYLLAKGGVRVLCSLLDEYFAAFEKTLSNESNRNSGATSTPSVAQLSPILVLLIRTATCSSSGRIELKNLIFPNPWISHGEDDCEEEVPTDYLQQKMDPTDIPKGTLRARLIGMMTSLDSVLKRYCAELLYELCDKETGEFVSRTGFGNAIALMQIKGLC